MKRLLLTGATGFIGRACIAPLVARGYCVHTISTGRSAAPDGVTAWSGNLLDIERLPALVEEIAPSHLLHVAWDVTQRNYWAAPTNLDWLAAGEALLRAFAEFGGRRAVGVGTCAEYGWIVDRYNEFDAPLEPATLYGECKLALGKSFQAAEVHAMSTAWGRLFFPFGPGERAGRLLSSVVTNLISEQPAECTAGTQLRDFIYIDDVGGALAALLDSDVQGPVNIGSGIATSVRDIVLHAAACIGRPDLVRLGALPTRPGDPPSIVAGTDRLNREVGFIPTTQLVDGIQRTVVYWLEHRSKLEALQGHKA